jgi:hypothetical protein
MAEDRLRYWRDLFDREWERYEKMMGPHRARLVNITAGDPEDDRIAAMYGAVGSWPTPPKPKPGDLPVPESEAEVDEWIAATLRMPRGALCRLYRLLNVAERITMNHGQAEAEEKRWIEGLRRKAKS